MLTMAKVTLFLEYPKDFSFFTERFYINAFLTSGGITYHL